MSRTRSFLVDAGSNYLRMLATIVGTVFLTRAMALHWGIDDFGRWSFIMSVLGFGLLLDLGLSNVVLKAAGGTDQKAASEILSSVFVGFLVVSTAAGVILAGVLWWMLPNSASGVLWAIVVLSVRATVATLPWTVFRSALYARGRMSIANAMQGVGALLYSAAACWVLHLGGGIAGVAWVSLAFTVSDSVVLVAMVRRYLPDIRLRAEFRYQSLRPSLSLGGASLLINVAGLILLKTDPIIVKSFLPIAQVAIYAVALRIAENIFLLCKQLVNALTPHAIKAGADGEIDLLARLFQRATRYVLAFGTSLYIAAVMLGRDAIRLWLSPEYEPSAAILNILLLAMVLSIPQLVGSNLMTFSGRHKTVAAFVGFGAALNVLASIVLVQFLGTSGVAFGTLVTTILIDVLFVIPFSCKHFGVSSWRFLGEIVWAVAVPGACQFVLLVIARNQFRAATLLGVVVQAVLSAAVFAGVFSVIGVTAEERRSLAAALGPKRITAPEPWPNEAV